MESTLAKLVKEAREKLNLSQRELAEKSNVDYSYIAKIENGTRKKPSLDILYNLSKNLGISFFNLVESASYSKKEINALRFYSHTLQYDELMEDTKYNKIIPDCLSNSDDFVFIDIEKVFQLYKKGKININEAVNLASHCQLIDTDSEMGYFTENGFIKID